MSRATDRSPRPIFDLEEAIAVPEPRVMAKRYRSEVGAWQACLPVLHDREAPPGESS